MILRVYGDESGTHDITGQKDGSSTPTWCGYIHTPEYWDGFCRKWKQALNNYRAPYFHFREFANKKACVKNSSPYYGWNEEKRRSFLYDLAFLAGDSAVPCGGSSGAKHMHDNKLVGDPYERAIITFFKDFRTKLDRHWPNLTGKILFILDRSPNAPWLNPLHKAYDAFCKEDSRVGGLAFEDDKDEQHFGLQAADLLAYSFRQQAERCYAGGGKIPEMRLLDFILSRNMLIKLRQADMARWNRMILAMRQDEQKLTSQWAKEGKKEQKYFPLIHFTEFEKYGFNLKPEKPA